MEKDRQRNELFLQKLESNRILHAIRQGMILSLPVIITGSFALLLSSLPIAAYREWLQALLGGVPFQLLTQLQNATNAIISLVFLLAISYSYERSGSPRVAGLYPLTALCAYIAFMSNGTGEFTFDRFDSEWIFYAISIAIFSAILLEFLTRHLTWHTRKSAGEHTLFYTILPLLLPVGLCICCFALLNLLITALLRTPDFQTVLASVIVSLFDGMGRSLPSGLLFVFLLNFFWFFGIHGGMVLDLVARQFFIPGVDINAAIVAAGQAPTEILSKTFLDTFVLFGGCGSSLCLLVAILLIEKRKSFRSLAKIAAFPVLFNINELLVFGLPILLNPIYFIPFLLTPLILTLSSYFAVALHLVPYAVHSVEWTTPIFLSGFAATGSVAGALLQLFNLVLGVLIYLPFIRLSQRNYMHSVREQIAQLVHLVQAGEAMGKLPHLLEQDGRLSSMAHILAEDLEYAIQNRGLNLHYQPQVNERGELVGAEALLRWEYLPGLYLYPPLVIAITEERGLQNDLSDWIMQTVCADMAQWGREHQLHVPISFNVTASQLEDLRLPDSLRAIRQQYEIPPAMLGVELTEQAALSLSRNVELCLSAIRDAGAKILIDDFGMGHSSMMYLQNSHFDVVKLDGSLVQQLLINPRSSEIIASILYLSRSLDFEVCAEFVETEAQKERLRELGCLKYQGYLYSPALDKTRFIAFAQAMPTPNMQVLPEETER